MNVHPALARPARSLWLGLFACLASSLAAASEPTSTAVLIPYEKFTLENGLRVVVHRTPRPL